MTRLDRQSFLGVHSEERLKTSTLGIVGLCGGGSHIAQQSAHMGIGRYVLVDPQDVDEEGTNTNRLVGSTLEDVKNLEAKVHIAERVIRGVQPDADITLIKDIWQNAAEHLKRCDVVIGAVDSYKEREQLERFCRRHLIPYLDVGMNVTETKPGNHLVSGQVILSTPGFPCLRCCGVITETNLRAEAELYGAAGSRPQVVWSNGVLASSAIGILTQILTPWFSNPPSFVHLEYDGNIGTVKRNIRMDILMGKTCPHHPVNEMGDALMDVRDSLNLT